MVEGLGKGAELALLAVPMADAFIFSQAQFQRILSNFLGLKGAISIQHTHHCGGGAVRVLTEGTVNHLQVCPVLGRNSTRCGPRCTFALGGAKRRHRCRSCGDTTCGSTRKNLRC